MHHQTFPTSSKPRPTSVKSEKKLDFWGYYSRSSWKIVLILLALVIAGVSLTYTYVLVNKLSREERKKVKLWAEAYKELNRQNTSNDMTLVLEVIRNTGNVPAIMVNEAGEIKHHRNLDTNQDNSESYLRDKLRQMKNQNAPIEVRFGNGEKHYIYYLESTNLLLLKYFPIVQLVVIGLFLMVSYLALSTNRRYEQNQVWVGLAKETAHQLGTPLSSLMAWMAYFREMPERYEPEIIEELEKDVDKLNTITERFSKIGSAPVLQYTNLYAVVEHSAHYMQRRISGNIKVSIKPGVETGLKTYLNRPLFEWVLENIIKNAVDAMPGTGEIRFDVQEQGRWIAVDIEDTGKGIEKRNQRSVFTPGYSTRKRGWGLGLSLSKRIIEDYHRGQIYVKHSEPGKGTTFRIRLRSALDK